MVAKLVSVNEKTPKCIQIWLLPRSFIMFEKCITYRQLKHQKMSKKCLSVRARLSVDARMPQF